jgi:hypothetical protein
MRQVHSGEGAICNMRDQAGRQEPGPGFVRWPKVRKMLRRLRRPGYRWVRIPAGVLLVLFGLFGFLPVLGFWMIPLGLWLLAVDIPAVRRLNRFLAKRFGWNRNQPSRSDPDAAADDQGKDQAKTTRSSPDRDAADDSVPERRTGCR